MHNLSAEETTRAYYQQYYFLLSSARRHRTLSTVTPLYVQGREFRSANIKKVLQSSTTLDKTQTEIPVPRSHLNPQGMASRLSGTSFSGLFCFPRVRIRYQCPELHLAGDSKVCTRPPPRSSATSVCCTGSIGEHAARHCQDFGSKMRSAEGKAPVTAEIGRRSNADI